MSSLLDCHWNQTDIVYREVDMETGGGHTQLYCIIEIQ
jgi:hypothetical protein